MKVKEHAEEAQKNPFSVILLKESIMSVWVG